ncbi:MAG TPA: adenylate kinase family protein [Methanomassiliicoccales archaeon]|nr:adenylate kinase family protein [Methanomassiliicoccales archaeon]
MRLAISGTPGTGKTAAAGILASRGMRVVELNQFAKEHGLLGALDRKRKTREIDVGKLDSTLLSERTDNVVLVGHLSHLLTADMVIILRTRPSVLRKRLEARGYPEAKVRENLEAEACDVILIEALERSKDVFEIDTTERTPEETADAIDEILAGKTKKYEPGNIDWSGEVLGWY